MYRSILFLFFLGISCVPDLKERGYDTKALAREIKDRKIKKLTPIQVNGWVYDRSLQIVNLLNTSVQQKGIVEISKVNSLKTKDSLEKIYRFQIQILDLRTLPLNSYQGKQKSLLESCEYQYQNRQTLENSLQELENKDFFFVAGVSSIPYALWAIYFPKKEIIRSIDQKEFNP